MPSELGCQRDLFDIPDEVSYLNAAYMGPLSREVVAAGRAGLERKSRPWTIRPSDFFEPLARLRSLFGKLVGGDAEGVAIIPSVSYGLAVAARNLPITAGQKIVLLAEQFPSNVYVWHDLARRKGAEVVTVARPPDEDWTRAVLAAIDEGTAIVSVPQCHWTDGTFIDLTKTSKKASEVGAAVVVDGIQTVGAVPFDVKEVQPDFLVVSSYKWLLGPYSIGLLWCAPKRREGRPIEHNWITHEGSEDFAHLVDYRWDLRKGGARYDVGEVSNFALVPALIAALEQNLAWGAGAISSYTAKLNEKIAAGADALGLGVTPAELRGPHLQGIHLRGTDPEVVAASMREADVHVSVRGAAVRVAPHVYNNAGDVDRFIEALERSLRSSR
jgi:selenocysteine lyase/cysteine desulfurase